MFTGKLADLMRSGRGVTRHALWSRYLGRAVLGSGRGEPCVIHAASGPLALVPRTLGEKVYALPVDPTVAPDTDAPQPAKEIEEEDARPSVPAPMVPGPTDEERRCHDLTHLPFRHWCPFCVAGRDKDDCHRRKADTPGPPILELDYVFLRTGLPGDRTAIVLVGMMKGTGFAFAKVVSRKGKSDPMAVADILQWCRTEVGLHGELRVRTDGEPAIQALAADFAVRRARLSTLVETTPA